MYLNLIFVLLAVFAGSLVPIQTGYNNQLSRALNSPYWTSLVVFGVGFLLMSIILVVNRAPIPVKSQISNAPYFSWVAGALVGITYMYLMMICSPKLGAAGVVGFVVLGQLLSSLIIDHFGLIGFQVHSINWQRILGVLLLIGGVYIIKNY